MNKQKEANNLGLLFIVTVLVYLSILFLGRVGVGILHLPIPWWGATFISEVFFLLPGIIYIKRKGKKIGEVIPFKKVKISTILLTLLLAVVTAPANMFANFFSQLFVPNAISEVSGTMISTGVFMLVIMSVIVAPLFEELTMRGIFYNRYKDTSSLFKAVLMAAFFFGLIHLNLNQFCYAFIMGIFFGLANIASGSIWTSFIMHATSNAGGVLIMILPSVLQQFMDEELARSLTEFELTRAEVLLILLVLLILAVIGALLSIPILRAIAKREGNTEALQSIFHKKENSARVLFNLPTIIAVILSFVAMFGWDKLMDIIF